MFPLGHTFGMKNVESDSATRVWSLSPEAYKGFEAFEVGSRKPKVQ